MCACVFNAEFDMQVKGKWSRGVQNDTMIDLSMMLIVFRIQKHICKVPQAIAFFHVCLC